MMAINSYMQNTTMDTYRDKSNNTFSAKPLPKINPIKVSPTATEVIQDFSQNLDEIKKSAAQLQQLSDIITDRKLQFRVNDELGQVVIKIVDKDTDRIVREIPSRDVQNLKIALRHAMGVIFNDMA